jgi:hypothetical protein
VVGFLDRSVRLARTQSLRRTWTAPGCPQVWLHRHPCRWQRPHGLDDGGTQGLEYVDLAEELQPLLRHAERDTALAGSLFLAPGDRSGQLGAAGVVRRGGRSLASAALDWCD